MTMEEFYNLKRGDLLFNFNTDKEYRFREFDDEGDGIADRVDGETYNYIFKSSLSLSWWKLLEKKADKIYCPVVESVVVCQSVNSKEVWKWA